MVVSDTRAPATARSGVAPAELARPFLTVAELVQLPQLSGSRLLAGIAPASDRQVRRASVQEVPLQDFVRSDELVMTTGIELGEDVAALAHFVEDVANAGAAGLAIAIGYHVDAIPDAVITRADALGFPVVEFPWDLRFSEVTEAILDRAIERQHALLLQSERLHDLFTELVLGGGSMGQLCDSVWSLVGRAVAVQNQWDERVGKTSDGVIDPASDNIDVPIVAGSRTLGMLVVERRGTKLTDWDSIVVAHASTAAALLLLMEEATDGARARDASEFVSAAINRWSDAAPEIEHWARRLGIDPRGPAIVALASFHWPVDEWDERASSAARWALERALSGRRTRALVMWQGPDVTLIIPTGSIDPEELIRILADDVRALVRRHEHLACVTWGVGGVADGLGAVAERYQDARVAARLGHVVRGHDAITHYSDLGAFPALYEAVGNGRAAQGFRELQARYLDPVLENERRTGLALTRTLQAYFAKNGNVSAAARELRLNRQSMIYRITKIEELTGIDLDDPGPRFALELALRSWELEVHAAQAVGATAEVDPFGSH